MDLWVYAVAGWVGVGVVFGLFGAFVAGQKRRGSGEGLALGFLFGPLGVLVEALLPNGPAPASGSRPGSRAIATVAPVATGHLDPELLGFVTAKMGEMLDQSDPGWRLLSYHRKNALVGPIDKRLRSFVMDTRKLTASEYADYASAARRSLIG